MLNTDTIRLATDKMGRDVAIIPDDVATAMRREILKGWREIPDVADGGYSRTFTPGHWMHAAAELLLATMPSAYTFVVGESGWNDATSWWTDYPNDAHLHVPGSPGRTYRSTFGGRDGYAWSS